MSTDWNVVCHDCRSYHHLGQRFTSGPCFGCGSEDIEGRLAAANFIKSHADYNKPIEICLSDDTPVGYIERENLFLCANEEDKTVIHFDGKESEIVTPSHRTDLEFKEGDQIKVIIPSSHYSSYNKNKGILKAPTGIKGLWYVKIEYDIVRIPEIFMEIFTKPENEK